MKPRRLKVLVASDSWKDCLAAPAVCAAMAEGAARAAGIDLIVIALSDGGQGWTETLIAATSGRRSLVDVTGPRGERVEASFGLLGYGETAAIEMAAASGLELVPPAERNPWNTTTRGAGELLLAAKNAGANKIVLGIGGSATNDGGAGMAQALGYRLLDEEGEPIPPGGGGLEKLNRIEPGDGPLALEGIEIEVACDVTNPLCGENGASAVFGPQKGADKPMIGRLDAALARLAKIVERDLGRKVADIPGAGAAGGLGAGLLAFTSANLRRGIELAIQETGLQECLAGADLCLTGEGTLDASSAYGKTVAGVAAACAETGVSCVAICGSVRPEAKSLLDKGLTAYFSVAPGPATLWESTAHAAEWIADRAEQVVRTFAAAASRRR
jgi:glycerate kinase